MTIHQAETRDQRYRTKQRARLAMLTRALEDIASGEWTDQAEAIAKMALEGRYVGK